MNQCRSTRAQPSSVRDARWLGKGARITSTCLCAAALFAWPQLAHATNWAVITSTGDDPQFGPEGIAVTQAMTTVGWNAQLLNGQYFAASAGDPTFLTGTASQQGYVGSGLAPEILWTLRNVTAGDNVFLDLQGHGSDPKVTLTDSNGQEYTGAWAGDLNPLLQQTVPYPFDNYLKDGTGLIGRTPALASYQNYYGNHFVNVDMTFPGPVDLSGYGTKDFIFGFSMITTQTDANVAIVNQRPTCGDGMFWDVRMVNGLIYVETDDGLGNYILLQSPTRVNDGGTHTIVVSRASGELSLSLDGSVVASGWSGASFGTLPAMKTKSDVCGVNYTGQLFIGGPVWAPKAPMDLDVYGIMGIARWVRAQGATITVVDHSCMGGATARALEDFGDNGVCAISTTGLMGPGLTGYPPISSFIANLPWSSSQGATMDDIATYIASSYNAGDHTQAGRVESSGFRSGCNKTMPMRDTFYLAEQGTSPGWWNLFRPSYVLRNPQSYIAPNTNSTMSDISSISAATYWNNMLSQAITELYSDNTVTQDPAGSTAWTYYNRVVGITAVLDRLDADMLADTDFGFSPSAGWLSPDAYLRAAFRGCYDTSAPVSFPQGYTQASVCADPTGFVKNVLGLVPTNPASGIPALQDYNTLMAWDAGGDVTAALPLEQELEAFENTCVSPACSSITLMPNQEARREER